ncbi:MAG: UDP-glucose 4-epimerase GalE [Ignavibacteriales bacterium]|nr:UDP-glucose 4-epimerase GalE [Ignavibacteriales bacterium]
MKTILVTGGAGYIGSHTVRLLLKNNYTVIVLDNLSRGHKESLPPDVKFLQVDLLNRTAMLHAFKDLHIDAVIHFAAFAYVGESVENPLMYYENNVIGSYNLISVLHELGIKHIVFSSTCSIYGNPVSVPINEGQVSAPINPYANTKLFIEHILHDADTAHGIKSVCLRYFNAAGASANAEIGESHDPEPHLIPLVLFTALGKRPFIKVFGNDYPTPDGTCIRDYIHVDDLADAHQRAVEYLLSGNPSTIINLGTGDGNSVMEVIKTAEEVTGIEIPFQMVERRAGDPAVLVADNKKAREILGWNPVNGIREVLQTAWDWHQNPKY